MYDTTIIIYNQHISFDTFPSLSPTWKILSTHWNKEEDRRTIISGPSYELVSQQVLVGLILSELSITNYYNISEEIRIMYLVSRRVSGQRGIPDLDIWCVSSLFCVWRNEDDSQWL